ncbi:MAG: hypothetical protein OYH76_13290 [Defluviicoccus sp.]|nr:hypothetical protein [Defluviicoccus sp.]MDE0276863.1 hypothetical protein [Defluviicoccus sp.]
MMLTIDSWVFADARIQGVTLHPVVGAYELRFGLFLVVTPVTGDEHRSAIIDGARVSVGTGGGLATDLGFARPDGRIEIVPGRHQQRTAPTLSLPLQPGQLAEIEKLRGSADLHFDLAIKGTGSNREEAGAVDGALGCNVPRSEWTGKLREANARNILLLEVALPFPQSSERWRQIADELLGAERRFRDGDYPACVAACRVVVDELGRQQFGAKNWAGPSLRRLSSDERDKMPKDERARAILSALRHYTHQAHHGQSDGGETGYSRADAQLILTSVASFVAHSRSE